MPKKARPDFFLLSLVAILVGIGIVMIYSASAIVALKIHNTPYYFLQRQLLWAVIGAAGLWMTFRFDYRRYHYLAVPAALLSAGLLVAVLVLPVGEVTAGGVRRWMRAGPVYFQPSEVAKLGLIVFLAHVLVKKRARLPGGVKTLALELALVAVCLLLIMFEPDLGTALTIGSAMAVLLFVGGLKTRDLVLAVMAGLPAVIYSLIKHPYQKERVLAALDPWKDPFGSGFQVIQSYLALGRGGLLGLGPAGSRQKLFFLPAPHTDFVLAIIGEETGFAGLMVVIVLFALILWRGVRIALRAPDHFGMYLAFGLTFMLFLQFLLNAGVVAGLLPTKGMTMPFLSYGGTSLVVSLAGIGILLNISQHAVSRRAE